MILIWYHYYRMNNAYRRRVYIFLALFLIIKFAFVASLEAEDKLGQGDIQMKQKATFAAGCFWGVEAAFSKVKGVLATRVGYTGGSLKNPSYEDVCSGLTGHAEAVEVEYDPVKVSYDELLNVFWSIHDPTTIDRQGPDTGSQYRSVIFFHTPEQEAIARNSKKNIEKTGKFKSPIATQIVPAGPFYEAEEHHQRYLEKHGLPSCKI
jgi:peptide-methionine (S)-S-oxide reductase